MKQVVIENPVINSPYDEPKRHFKFTEEGITDEIIEERRWSAYFIPIARPRSRGEGELNLIIEVTGELKKDKVAKVSTAKTLWIPAINNHGGFGRWAFIEITDPWNAKNEIRVALKALV